MFSLFRKSQSAQGTRSAASLSPAKLDPDRMPELAESPEREIDPSPEIPLELGPPPLEAILLVHGPVYPLAPLGKALLRAKLNGLTPLEVTLTDHILTFSIGDELASASPKAASFPLPDLDGLFSHAWMWPPDASRDVVRDHSSHVVLNFHDGHSNPVGRRLALSQLCAIAAQYPDVVGVYWPEGNLLHHPDVLIPLAEQMTSPEDPPVLLWVDLRVIENPDGTSSLLTTGLPSLGHMDIEIPAIHMHPGELREWMLNVISYLLKNGPVLRDGDTVGPTPDLRLRIRHLPSGFGREGTVIQFLA